MTKVLTGIEVLKEKGINILKGKRLGLLCNSASLDSSLTHSKFVLNSLFPNSLKILFSPQHGISLTEQDNMIESTDGYDEDLKIPVFSLYSKTRSPTPEMLDLIDTLIVDLQDVGCRVYTFSSTVLSCLRECAKVGKEVVILDRPNPMGGAIVEGNVLEDKMRSFVGPFPLPMRHGLTMAEMALMFNQVMNIDCELRIIKMKGWNRNMLWEDTGLYWVMPSPNMPTVRTAMVYPGQVLWEGTNISEGRGTCRPFEIFGSPYLNTKIIRKELPPLKGCVLQEIHFRPKFNKWANELCRGFFIHITDPKHFRPFMMTLTLIHTIIRLFKEDFCWRDPPYEYEYNQLPIDIIIGSNKLRKDIERGKDLTLIKAEIDSQLDQYLEFRKRYLLYE